MSKLYLIRKNHTSIIGPMTISELRDVIKRMEICIQDEVCGNANNWVALDDMQRLRRKYPQIAEVVKKDLLNDWGISESTEFKIAKKSFKSKKTIISKKKRPSSKGPFMFFIFALLCLVIIFIGKKQKYYSLQNFSQEQFISLQQNHKLMKLSKIIKVHFNTINKIIAKNDIESEKLLRSVRSYIFIDGGKVSRLNYKLIRGRDFINSTPSNCSVKNWIKIWKQTSAIHELTLNEVDLKNKWESIMFWDPNWVYRHRSRSWKNPINYNFACLKNAKIALNKFVKTSPLKQQKYNNFVLRLDYLIKASSNIDINIAKTNYINAPVLSKLNCIEQANSFADIKKCSMITTKYDLYFKEKINIQYLEILFRKIDDETSSTIVKELLSKEINNFGIFKKDPYTFFKYEEHFALYTFLSKEKLSLSDALQKTHNIYPLFKLQAVDFNRK